MKNPGLWLVSRVFLSFYGCSADASVMTSCSRAMHFFNIRNTRSGKIQASWGSITDILFFVWEWCGQAGIETSYL